MLGLLSYALKQVIIELCPEKSSNHEKHGWNFYSKAVFLQLLSIELKETHFYGFVSSALDSTTSFTQDSLRWG